MAEDDVQARFGTIQDPKELQIKMPWRAMIMGEPERLLEWASAGAMTQVRFSDRSVACLRGDGWTVTRGAQDVSEAADFVVALKSRML